MKNMKVLQLASILCVVMASAVYADDVRVTSLFDKRSVHVNEEIHLTIRIEGAQGNVQAPRLPGFKGFDTFYTGRASHLTFMNGRSSSTVEFSYVLIPQVAGSFALDPIEVTVDKRNFRTEPITIEVLASQGQTQRASRQQAAPAPAAPAVPSAGNLPGGGAPVPAPLPQTGDDNIFVQAWIDKNYAYPNEQVLLTYSLYTRYDTRYEGFEEEPSISGFWIEEFPMEKEIAKETVRVNGQRYIKADIRRIALFPTAAAEYTIQPGTIKASIREEPQRTSIFDDFFNDSFFSGGSFFARRVNRLLKPAPLLLKVNPLPESGKPSGFQGAVGNFNMTGTVDRRTVKQNEPVTLTCVIEGQGNIETLNKPEIPEIKEFKIYDADTTSQLFNTGNVIGGRKTFEIVFVPKEAGTATIPSLEFGFFNPHTQKYEVRKTPEFKIEVAPSDQPFQIPRAISGQDVFKKDIRVEGRDIHYLWEKLPDETLQRTFKMILHALKAGNLLLLVLFVFGLVRARTEAVFEKDSALRRRKLAKAAALGKFRKLKKLGRSSKDNALAVYFEELDKILTQYLADKFNLSTYGGTRTEFENELEIALGTEDALYREIRELYRICDESRFGKGSIREEDRKRAVKILRQTINRVERIRR